MTPEGRVKKSVKALLEPYKPRLYCNWPVPAGYGESTLDCFGWLNGHAFAIETKAPGEGLTPRQQLIGDDMARAGAAVFVIGEQMYGDGTEWKYSGEEQLKKWLQRHS